MKKLSLEMLRLTSDEVLQRSQMKKITGGYGGDNCCIHLRSISTGAYLGRSCGLSFSVAREYYFMQQGFADGSYTSGYCCASC